MTPSQSLFHILFILYNSLKNSYKYKEQSFNFLFFNKYFLNIESNFIRGVFVIYHIIKLWILGNLLLK